MVRRGIKIVASYIVDNILCKIGDPMFAGFTVENKYQSTYFDPHYLILLVSKSPLKFAQKLIQKKELVLLL